MLEMYEVIFEVYIEDKLTNRQQMHAPKEMLISNFVETAKQIKNDQRPIKIKMIRPYAIWDEFEKKQKSLSNEIMINNNAMDIWEEKRQNE
jgi:hypothetical protein